MQDWGAVGARGITWLVKHPWVRNVPGPVVGISLGVVEGSRC